jgi:hypothetical protein
MVRAALSREQRQQGEDAGIGRGAKRQWRQRMGAPTQSTDNMPEPSYRME